MRSMISHHCFSFWALVLFFQILKLLLLQLDLSLTPMTRSLILGCTVSITSICCHRRSKVAWMPIGTVFEYLTELTVLREGELIVLKSLTAEPKLNIAEVVTVDQVNGVVEKLVATLKNENVEVSSTSASSSSSSSSVKQLTLEILASLCLQVEVENVAAIIDYIFSMLDHSTDAEFHQVCGTQLKRLFQALPKEHPLVSEISLGSFI